ncbi:hypothetical protein D3C76_1515640 [compost metagenome]
MHQPHGKCFAHQTGTACSGNKNLFRLKNVLGHRLHVPIIDLAECALQLFQNAGCILFTVHPLTLV